MGPPEHQPGLPEFEFAMVPPEQTYTSKRLQYCNWLQAMEGGIDSSHVSWLHRDAFRSDPLMVGSRGNQYNLGDAMPVFEVVDQPAGLFIGARRNAEGALLLAHHALVHAVVHHDPAARQPSGARAFLDSDRRRELLGLELRLSPDARSDRDGAAGNARRQGHPHAHHPWHVSFRWPTATTTT